MNPEFLTRSKSSKNSNYNLQIGVPWNCSFLHDPKVPNNLPKKKYNKNDIAVHDPKVPKNVLQFTKKIPSKCFFLQDPEVPKNLLQFTKKVP